MHACKHIHTHTHTHAHTHTPAVGIGKGSTQEAEESKRNARESHVLASSLQTKMQEMVLDMEEITKARISQKHSLLCLCLYIANVLSTDGVEKFH